MSDITGCLLKSGIGKVRFHCITFYCLGSGFSERTDVFVQIYFHGHMSTTKLTNY